jgi:hypothetical protein
LSRKCLRRAGFANPAIASEEIEVFISRTTATWPTLSSGRRAYAFTSARRTSLPLDPIFS